MEQAVAERERESYYVQTSATSLDMEIHFTPEGKHKTT